MLLLLALIVAVITAASASAALLIVDAGTLQVVDAEVVRPIQSVDDHDCEKNDDDEECDDDGNVYACDDDDDCEDRDDDTCDDDECDEDDDGPDESAGERGQPTALADGPPVNGFSTREVQLASVVVEPSTVASELVVPGVLQDSETATPEPAPQLASDPTSTPTPEPATPTEPVPTPTDPSPTPTPIPEPTESVTSEPVEQGNVQSAGAPPGPIPGISWFFHTCVAENAGLSGWEIMLSERPGVIAAEIADAPTGLVLTCDVSVANIGVAPLTIENVVADFDPAAFAVDAELGDRVALEPCAAAPEWGSEPDSLSTNCWQIVRITIRLGAPVALDWLTFGVAVSAES